VTKHLLDERHEVAGYFYNPNIHPYEEYLRRLAAARTWAESAGVLLLSDESYAADESYAPPTWIKEAASSLSDRCRACYHLRLEKTAARAKAAGYDAFSTTLLISPYQKHDELVTVAEAVALHVGIPFYYRDFRPHFNATFAPARALGLYRQNYCGCLLSAYERRTRPQRQK
jgi:predicted adenine nucleotide alpha hydrolase (AANH) superfamily ATPase